MSKSSLWAPVLAAALGCADIGEARRVQDASSAGPGERTVTARELGLAAEPPLTLEGGLEIALTHNPSVALARSRAEAAMARLEGAAAGRRPQLDADASFRGSVSGTGINAAPSLRGASGSRDASQGGGLSLSQLLFDFGKTNALLDQADGETQAALADLQAAANDVAYDYRSAFFNLQKQQELLRVAEETVRQFRKRLEQVEGFVQVGTRVRYDLTKAQVDLGNAQLDAVRAGTALRDAHAALGNVMGLVEDISFTPVNPGPTEGSAEVDVEALVAESRKSHPQLAALAARERAAQAAIDAAVADLFPQLSLQGSYSWSGALSPAGWTARAGAILNGTLYGGGEKTVRLRETVAGLRGVRAQRAQAEQQLALQVRRAVTQWWDALGRVEISGLTEKQAWENLDLVQGRYEIGRASSVELTDAQVALSNARGERIQAEYDVHIAEAAIRRARGVVR